MTKKTKIILIVVSIIIILIALGGVLASQKANQTEYQTQPVKKADLIQTVSVTGTVESATAINLSFKTSGQLGELKIQEGQTVELDQLLASLKAPDLLNNIQQAEANLNSTQAEYNLKLAGASDEEIKVAQVQVKAAQAELNKSQVDYQNTLSTDQNNIDQAEIDIDKAKADLNNYTAYYDQLVDDSYVDLRNTLKDSGVDVSSALTECDNVLGVDNTGVNDEFEDYLGVRNSQSKINAVNSYNQAVEKYENLEPVLESLNLTSTHDEIQSTLNTTETAMSSAATALDRVKTLLNYTISASGFTEAELEALKDSVDSKRTSLNAAIAALTTDRQAVQTAELNYQTYSASYQSAYDKAVANLDKMRQTAENNERTYSNLIEIKQATLESAQANLELKQAPARNVDLAAYLSRIKEARTNLELAQINYKNALIKSPIAGVVTEVNYKIGEQITASSPVISLIAKSGLEIKADVPESDIAKVDIGDPVEITLDAYGDENIFKGSVSFIDLAETVIQDVVYYGIKIQFDNDIQSIKPGMTANSAIETAHKENVLQVPIRAVKSRNGDRMVDILVNKEVVQKKVATGLRGDNYMEILSGLEVGQEVITFIKDN